MNWDKFNLHIENLVPGVVITAVLLWVWPSHLISTAQNTIILGAVFVAMSYMVGAIGNVLAYLLLNSVSAATFRPVMLRAFAARGFECVACDSRSTINQRFSEVLDIGVSCGNPRIEAEVEKRRQTGRMLRSALSPTWLFVLGTSAHHQWSFVTLILALTGSYVALLLLFGFAEVIVFKEGLRGERVAMADRRAKERLNMPGSPGQMNQNGTHVAVPPMVEA